MDRVHVVWHKVLREDQSIQAVAKQLGASPNAVAEHSKVSEPWPVREEVAPQVESRVARGSRGRALAYPAHDPGVSEGGGLAYL